MLKRVNTGEMDRVVTLLTPDQGKLVCVAKGVRKMSSSQRAYLEPGNHVSVLLIHTSSLPIITQTRLIDEFPSSKKDLPSMKRLAEVLEIIDVLFPEGVEEVELFDQLVAVLERLNQPQVNFKHIQDNLNDVLMQMGYQDFHETSFDSILEHVSSVAERPLNSYKYLTVKKM